MNTATALNIRAATAADAPALLAIYTPFVTDTTVSFELEVPSLAEFTERIRKSLDGWAWLVAQREGQILGYAYGSAHRTRRAYQWSVDVSVYVDPTYHRQGIARTLYTALFDELAAKGYCNAFAGIALPNDASIGLHRRVGFELVGVYKNVGRKFGAWHDVAWFQRHLRDEPPVD